MGRLLQPDTRQLSEYNLKAGDMVYVTAGVRGPTSFSFGEPLVSKESSGDVKGKLISGDAKGKLVSGAVSGDSKKKPIATPSVITSEVDPVSQSFSI
jgi:hypothetical protein